MTTRDTEQPYQIEPRSIDEVVTAVRSGHHYLGASTAAPAMRDTYRRRPVAGTQLLVKLEDAEIERLTAPIPWAHLEGISGPEADAASVTYTRLRELRDRLDDIDLRFAAVVRAEVEAPKAAATAARVAIEAGKPVPRVTARDVDSELRTLQAEYSAVVEMLQAASAAYRAAASRVAPIAREALALQLPTLVAATREAWLAFRSRNDERWRIVEQLDVLNRRVDGEWRGVDVVDRRREQRLGGSLQLLNEQQRSDLLHAARQAMQTLDTVTGSADTTITGEYVADELHTGGRFPIWWRRYAAQGDPRLLQEAEHDDTVKRGVTVDVDTIPTPAERAAQHAAG
jgi:hypothetical protein